MDRINVEIKTPFGSFRIEKEEQTMLKKGESKLIRKRHHWIFSKLFLLQISDNGDVTVTEV